MLFKLSVLIDINIETHSAYNIGLRIVSYQIQDGLMYISLSKIVSSCPIPGLYLPFPIAVHFRNSFLRTR